MTESRQPAAPSGIEATVVYLNGPRRLELRKEELQPGLLGPRRLLCETSVTAISPGTELAAYLGLPALRPGNAYPRVQGYCNVARVLAAGSEVSGVRPGDRVLSFTSHRSHFFLDESEVLTVLPREVRNEDAVCAYLYHLGYDAVLRSAVKAGSRVLVVGLGVLGLASVAMAGIAGASVVALSDQEVPRRIGMDFGATATFPRGELAGLRAALGSGADVVILTTNSWSDWHIALELAGTRATLACLGFPGRGQPPPPFNPLDSAFFYAKQLRIEAVGLAPERADARGFLRFNERDNLAYLVGLIRAGKLDPRPLVSATYAGADIDMAYQDLAARKNSAITYLLRWN